MVKDNWALNGPPFTDFTEELTEEWKKVGGIGFSLNIARDWLNIGLKKEDYDFAYWLELNGYSPEWVLNHGDKKELRKKYRKFIKKQPKPKQPKVEPEKPRDPHNCEKCNKNQFYSFKDWQQLHGERKRDLSEPWITVIRRPFKNSGYMEYIEMCGECKVRNIPYLNTCFWSKK